MQDYLKQIGTEDSEIILSVSDSAKSLYEKCKEVSKLTVKYHTEVIDRLEDHSKAKLKQYTNEFSKLFRSLIEPFISEQRLSILDIWHSEKEENPVPITCQTLIIDGLKIKDFLGMIYKEERPSLYSLMMENAPLQTLEETLYGYIPHLVCNLDESIIKMWGYLQITDYAIRDNVGLIVVEDIANIIEKGPEQFNLPLKCGSLMTIPISKMRDTIDYFTKIYKNKNIQEWLRLEMYREDIKDEKDDVIRSFLFGHYKSEILKISKEIPR